MNFRRGRKRWVFKISGSLDKAGFLDRLIPVIDELSLNLSLVVAPGGGAFADFIRKRFKQRMLSEKTAHAQAVLSVGQYGYELADRLKKGVVVHNSSQVATALKSGATPVFIPYPCAAVEKRIPASWDATSDTIAAEVCRYLGFGGLVLLKSVDGIFENGRLRSEVSKNVMKKSGVVDPVLSKRLEPGWDVFIINGRKPERLKELLITGSTVMTKILC